MTQWIMVAISTAALILSVLVPIIVAISRANKDTAKELSDHKTHVAETYATKTDFDKLTERMERQLQNGFDTLERLLTKSKD
ncbi:hypothetical protein [Pseudoalteromonas sp. SMN1298-MNA-CIBAN-0114]|jgi:hypothetical protein|uniref:hypothetical protein n=1 Tax=Pseudoalteromonas sp. SMN1298-MNA-CIBAN-0114 TaxID=3140428 RepID=UPI00332E19DC|tara:strand:+ start:211 stop:456 length:246 start_codon:yes stop_codon:yes gene_type:complete